MEIANRQILRSDNGRKCLSKCYSKEEKSVHPLLLVPLHSTLDGYCAIDPVFDKEAENFQSNLIYVDKCHVGDNGKYHTPNELNSLLFNFNFDPADFLSDFYHLKNFDDVIAWTLNHSYYPFDTIKRIHNCAWKVYGSNLESLTHIVINYYYSLAKESWLPDYLPEIENYFSFETRGESPENLIIEKYFSYAFFNYIIKSYILEKKSQWEIIESHFGQIKKYVLEKLIDAIKNKKQ